jgi:predicted Zn finger-like uncharacterized protein
VKFLCEQCKAKYQIADDKAAGKTVRMKCRKCGYLIEVRATATEGSTSASQPPAAGERSSKPPSAPRAPQKPAAPRAGPLATSLASARSPAKPAGPLANALKSALQRDEEVSAPVDMSDLSPSDEWYVAINGVPVGPIRIGEVRRKAAIGAVTDESLCWQEGLDEWRPLRSFPELAALVREAFTSGRSSITPQPPPDGRASLPPAGRSSVRPAPPAGSAPTAPRAPSARGPVVSAPPAAARSNVVPFTARHATAEKLAEEPDDLTRPFMGPPVTPAHAVEPDPFAAPPRPNPGPMAPGFSYATSTAPTAAAMPMSPSPSLPFVAPAKKGPPWMAIAMVAAATAFGVTAAIALFLRPQAPPTPVVVQVPGAPPTVVAGGPAVTPTATTSADMPEPGTAPTTTAGGSKPVTAAAPKAASSSAAAQAAPPGHGPLNLQGLTGSTIAPTDDQGGGGDSPKAPGQCISEGQVQQVIGLHSVGLRRACWERSTASKTTANVTVSLTIGADGSAQGVSASGDEASVASCIASDVRNWHFPAMGCSQRTAIPFHFVRQ